MRTAHGWVSKYPSPKTGEVINSKVVNGMTGAGEVYSISRSIMVLSGKKLKSGTRGGRDWSRSMLLFIKIRKASNEVQKDYLRRLWKGRRGLGARLPSLQKLPCRTFEDSLYGPNKYYTLSGPSTQMSNNRQVYFKIPFHSLKHSVYSNIYHTFFWIPKNG